MARMSGIELLRSSPYFCVRDVADSAKFYGDVLGFRTEYIVGTPPVFAICSRDGLPVMLRTVADPARMRPNESQGGTWDAFFWTRGAYALHRELLARGATVVYGPLVQHEYRMLEFAVRDCDGHVLGFGEPVSAGPGETVA